MQETIDAGVEKWTDERVETLKKLYAEDLSASAIAAELGGGLTRNAVLGKIHRLKLPGTPSKRPKPVKAAVRRTPPAKPRTAPAAAKRSTSTQGLAFKLNQAKIEGLTVHEAMDHVLGRDLVDGLGDPADGRPLLRLDQLTEATCKWPFGDPLKSGFGFCGAHSLEKQPYCAVHAKRAYSAVSVVRK